MKRYMWERDIDVYGNQLYTKVLFVPEAMWVAKLFTTCLPDEECEESKIYDRAGYWMRGRIGV